MVIDLVINSSCIINNDNKFSPFEIKILVIDLGVRMVQVSVFDGNRLFQQNSDNTKIWYRYLKNFEQKKPENFNQSESWEIKFGIKIMYHLKARALIWSKLNF